MSQPIGPRRFRSGSSMQGSLPQRDAYSRQIPQASPCQTGRYPCPTQLQQTIGYDRYWMSLPRGRILGIAPNGA